MICHRDWGVHPIARLVSLGSPRSFALSLVSCICCAGIVSEGKTPGVTGTMSVLFLFLLAGIVELGLPETLSSERILTAAKKTPPAGTPLQERRRRDHLIEAA